MKNLLDFHFMTGLVTSVKTRVLGASPEKWLTTTTYYDEVERG